MKTPQSPSDDPIEVLTKMPANAAAKSTEQIRLMSDFLPKLGFAVAANERAQRRFRTALIVRLSRIETVLNLIHGAQIVESHYSQPNRDEHIRKHAQETEEYVSEHSKAMGMKMVRFVYDDSEILEEPQKRGRRKKEAISFDI
jgi:hypothetical protein